MEKNVLRIEYSPYTAEWGVRGQHLASGDVKVSSVYGTSRMNAYSIIENTLNQKDVNVYDKADDGRSILNQKETTVAQQKQEIIKQAFQDWIFENPERRKELVGIYNEKMNSIRPREYNGRHIAFVGMNPGISLMEHQSNAVARILYGGNTMLAHEVGAGKTYEMIASAMEAKRLGLAQKSLFVVPNHLTEQTATAFMTLYPSANVLVATKRDFETANRKKFCSRIVTGDYDAVIIGHSQFERIPLSVERQKAFIAAQIQEIKNAKKWENSPFSTKQIEKAKKFLEAKYERLMNADKKDDVVMFEELGVDRLYVDEAHGYKNLYLRTRMNNVAGIPQTEAQKSSDLYAKCRYMDEITGNKGIIFATGTPISNSMTEMYTMMRYLQNDMLKEQKWEHFDAWAATFGEKTTSIELAPEGTGYRAKTRFAKFYNLPELMSIFKEVADIKTADELHLPRPKANFHTIAVEPTEEQQQLIESLSERAADIHDGRVDPHKDNMLKITSDGRKIGLDQRLMDPKLPDDPGSKVNTCMENIYKIWDETKKDKLTQLVFCDFSTPSKDKFNVYDDIRTKLVARGIPEKEIAYIHDADSEVKKKELFAKVRKGQVRILMGSTAKMGSGTNVQDKLIAIHDLDCPWRPADLEQRAGRIVRQGNKNPEVDIYRYVTKSTFDAYLYQTVENKQKFISQIITSKNPARSCEDVDESVLSYAEIKALCIGDPRIKEKMDLDIQVSRLRMLEGSHKSQQYKLQDDASKYYPKEIEKTKERIAKLERDVEHWNSRHNEEFIMTVTGETFGNKEKEEAGKAILKSFELVYGPKNTAHIGQYKGFDMRLSWDPVSQNMTLSLKVPEIKGMTYQVTLGETSLGNITRMENALSKIPDRLINAKEDLDDLNKQFAVAKEEMSRPFPQARELKEKIERLAELNILLNMDIKPEIDQQTEQQPECAGEPSQNEEKTLPTEMNAANPVCTQAIPLEAPQNEARDTFECGQRVSVHMKDKDRTLTGYVVQIGESAVIIRSGANDLKFRRGDNNLEILPALLEKSQENIALRSFFAPYKEAESAIAR
jgi:hypothetical protein